MTFTAQSPSRQRPVGENRPARYLLGAVAIIMGAVMLAPLALTLSGSLSPADAPPSYLPSALTLDNYVNLFHFSAGLLSYIHNSLGVAALTVAFSLALSIPAGYGLARFPIRFKEVWFLVLLAPIMIPYQVLVIPLYLDIAHLGIASTWLGLSLVHTMIQLPFSIFVMRLSFAGVPAEIEEAAQVDGSNSLRTLVSIFLPLIVPAIVTVTLFAFIASWNEFLAGLIFMNRESSFTLPVMLVTIRHGAQGIANLGPLQAGAIVAILPCLLVYLLLQRYFASVPIR